jgi:hypothetical protein
MLKGAQFGLWHGFLLTIPSMGRRSKDQELQMQDEEDRRWAEGVATSVQQERRGNQQQAGLGATCVKQERRGNQQQSGLGATSVKQESRGNQQQSVLGANADIERRRQDFLRRRNAQREAEERLQRTGQRHGAEQLPSEGAHGRKTISGRTVSREEGPHQQTWSLNCATASVVIGAEIELATLCATQNDAAAAVPTPREQPLGDREWQNRLEIAEKLLADQREAMARLQKRAGTADGLLVEASAARSRAQQRAEVAERVLAEQSEAMARLQKRAGTVEDLLAETSTAKFLAHQRAEVAERLLVEQKEALSRANARSIDAGH